MPSCTEGLSFCCSISLTVMDEGHHEQRISEPNILLPVRITRCRMPIINSQHCYISNSSKQPWWWEIRYLEIESICTMLYLWEEMGESKCCSETRARSEFHLCIKRLLSIQMINCSQPPSHRNKSCRRSVHASSLLILLYQEHCILNQFGVPNACKARYYIFTNYTGHVPAWPAHLWLNKGYLEIGIRNRTCIFHGSSPEEKKVCNTARGHRNTDYSLSHLKHILGFGKCLLRLDPAPGSKECFSFPPWWLCSIHGLLGLPLGQSSQSTFFLFLFPTGKAIAPWATQRVIFLLALCKEQNYGRNTSSLGKLCTLCHFFSWSWDPKHPKSHQEVSQRETPPSAKMPSPCLTFISWSWFQRHFTSEALLGPSTIYARHALLYS